MCTRHYAVAAVTVAVMGLGGLAVTAGQPGQPPQPSARQDPMATAPDLLGPLKATRGCLGVEAARTMSGQSVIFAWFEDKEAVLRWYYSEAHQSAQDLFFPDSNKGGHKPLEGIPDDIGPIMVVVSITPANRSNFEATNLPVSQIAIELYTPIAGGLYLGGRFAPESLEVKGMHDYTPKTDAPR